MAEAVRKRFWDLEKSAEMFRIERDTLIKRVKHLEWFEREMRRSRQLMKLLTSYTEIQLRQSFESSLGILKWQRARL